MRDRVPLCTVAHLDELFAAFRLEESVRIAGPVERVWELVTDIDRMTEFSPELVKVEWLDGATGPAVGARFAGKSRIDSFEWTRNCTITEFRPPHVFAWEVYDGADELPQSRWWFELTPDGDGTLLTQRFAHVPDGRSTVRLMAEAEPDAAEDTIDERAVMLIAGMRRTLEAIRDRSEAM